MDKNINNVSQDGIVEFKGVNKSYGTKNVLKNIDLNIPKGKIVGLLGPNGSGKSTMIKLMNGLLQPDNGEIMINGIKPSIETKKISFIFTRKNLFK
nr:ATP-binding cassette domain-containing protein [Clostridioides difficile]